MLTPDFIAQQKLRLEELLKNLQDRLVVLQSPVDMGGEVDDQVVEDEMIMEHESEAEMIVARIALVEKALEKIASGNYGTTDDGDVIPQDRLEKVPEADSIVHKNLEE